MTEKPCETCVKECAVLDRIFQRLDLLKDHYIAMRHEQPDGSHAVSECLDIIEEERNRDHA